MRLSKLAAAVVVSSGIIGAGLLGATTASAEGVKVKLEPYVTGLNAPLAMVQPDGDDRKFVVVQFGRMLTLAKSSGGRTRIQLPSLLCRQTTRMLPIRHQCESSQLPTGHSSTTMATG